MAIPPVNQQQPFTLEQLQELSRDPVGPFVVGLATDSLVDASRPRVSQINYIPKGLTFSELYVLAHKATPNFSWLGNRFVVISLSSWSHNPIKIKLPIDALADHVMEMVENRGFVFDSDIYKDAYERKLFEKLAERVDRIYDEGDKLAKRNFLNRLITAIRESFLACFSRNYEEFSQTRQEWQGGRRSLHSDDSHSAYRKMHEYYTENQFREKYPEFVGPKEQFSYPPHRNRNFPILLKGPLGGAESFPPTETSVNEAHPNPQPMSLEQIKRVCGQEWISKAKKCSHETIYSQELLDQTKRKLLEAGQRCRQD
jgi:predicted house-cleaning noncanonical NTP pyrophosphatase (MazG superfamily)